MTATPGQFLVKYMILKNFILLALRKHLIKYLYKSISYVVTGNCWKNEHK